MRVTIDGAGRLVVPKALGDALGLTAGTALEVRMPNGRLELAASGRPGGAVYDALMAFF